MPTGKAIVVQWLDVLLSPRMKFLMDILEPALLNMGIELGGGNIGMAEHELHRPKISAVLEQVRCKRMAQHMGTNLFVNGGLSGNFPEYLPVTNP